MATLYYNNVLEDADWNSLGNWWTDSAFSIPAANIPQGGDTVYIEGNVLTSPSVPVALVNVFVAALQTSTGFDIDITGVTSPCQFNNNSSNWGAIIGDCVFNDSSYNAYGYGGTNITGNCTFNDASYNQYVDGVDGGKITGNATFTADTFNNLDPVGLTILITGTITFTSATCTFNLFGYTWTEDISTWSFPNGSPIWNFDNASLEFTGNISNGYAINNSNISGYVGGDLTIGSGTTVYDGATIVGSLYIEGNTIDWGPIGSTITNQLQFLSTDVTLGVNFISYYGANLTFSSATVRNYSVNIATGNLIGCDTLYNYDGLFLQAFSPINTIYDMSETARYSYLGVGASYCNTLYIVRSNTKISSGVYNSSNINMTRFQDENNLAWIATNTFIQLTGIRDGGGINGSGILGLL